MFLAHWETFEPPSSLTQLTQKANKTQSPVHRHHMIKQYGSHSISIMTVDKTTVAHSRYDGELIPELLCQRSYVGGQMGAFHIFQDVSLTGIHWTPMKFLVPYSLIHS